MRPFIGWSATVVITLGRSRMGSSCPLLSSPTGNDPAFPKLTLIAHSHTGGLGASFGSAIAESLLPEKTIHLSRNTVPPGSNCYRLRHGKGFPAWKPLNLQRTFFLENLVLPENNSENLSTLPSESAPGFVPMFFSFTLQRTKICRLLSMAVKKVFCAGCGRWFQLRRFSKPCTAIELAKLCRWARLPQSSGCV